MRTALFLLMVSLTANAQPPEWTQETGRRVLGGDILHWGTGTSDTPEIALFKARQMAIQALMEECGGVASQEIVPRQQHVEPTGSGYTAFARASLEYDACERAKRGRAKENPKIADAQKLYKELLFGKTSETETKVRELLGAELDTIRSMTSSTMDEVGTLRKEVERLQLMVKQPVVQEQVTLPATDSQKKVCWEEYSELQQELTILAGEFNGNMADPSLVPKLNRLERKKALCQKLK
jgi:regulator of replication initiation timing